MNEQQDLSNDSKLIIEIIHKDADESLKIFRDNINSIDTRLAVIIGFDASFAAFLSKIPSKSIFLISGYTLMTGENYSNTYPGQIIKFFTDFINYLLTIKPLIGLSLIISLCLSINGLSPTPTQIILYPVKMLEQSKNTEKHLFLKGIIENRNETILKLERLVSKKAKMLNLALFFLGIAASIAITFIILDTSVTKWG
jgi:hypothetical protein